MSWVCASIINVEIQTIWLIFSSNLTMRHPVRICLEHSREMKGCIQDLAAYLPSTCCCRFAHIMPPAALRRWFRTFAVEGTRHAGVCPACLHCAAHRVPFSSTALCSQSSQVLDTGQGGSGMAVSNQDVHACVCGVLWLGLCLQDWLGQVSHPRHRSHHGCQAMLCIRIPFPNATVPACHFYLIKSVPSRLFCLVSANPPFAVTSTPLPLSCAF